MIKPQYQQGEIWWVNFSPSEGYELKDWHCAVVLQNDVINRNHRTTIVAPLIKGHREDHPYSVNVVPSSRNQLDQPRRIDLTQLKSVNHTRFRPDGPKGELEEEYLFELEDALVALFMGIFEVV